MATQLKLLWTLLFLTAGIIACQPTEPKSQTGAEFSTGILGGSEVQPSDLVAAFTVGLYDEQNGSRCTGSLISSDTVLTAAHCVDPSSKTLWISFGTKMTGSNRSSPEFVRAVAFQRHPQYDPKQNEGSDTHDLALVHFSGGLPSGHQSVELSTDSEGMLRSQPKLIAVGFGLSNGLFGTGAGILRWASLKFKKPHSATEFETEQAASGVCSGDSGGPLFLEQEGKLIQVGVASRVATKFLGCRGYAVYTRVDTYREWIVRTTEDLRAGH